MVRYLKLLEELDAGGISTRGWRGTRSTAHIAERVDEYTEELAGDNPPPLSYMGLGKNEAGADHVRTICGHDTWLRALASRDAFERLGGEEDLLLHTAAGQVERQASSSEGFLTNAPERDSPEGPRYPKQRGRQQTALLSAIARGSKPVLLSAQPPNWATSMPAYLDRGGGAAVAVRSGPAATCAALVQPVRSVLNLLPYNPLARRIVAGGRLAAKDGRVPPGIPLASWSVDAMVELRGLEVVPALDFNMTFRRGDGRQLGPRAAHSHFKRAGDTWKLDETPTPLTLPDALSGREHNVAAEIRYGSINGQAGAVISIMSNAPRADYMIFDDAHDPMLLSSILIGLLAGHGHLLLSGSYVAELDRAAAHVGLLDVYGHGHELPGLRAIGVLAANRRLERSQRR